MVTWQLTIDTNDPTRLATFWAPLLGYEPTPPPEGFDSWVAWYRSVGVPEDELSDVGPDYCDRIHDPAGHGPRIWFQIVPDAKVGKNRLHLDLYPTGPDRSSLSMAERRDIVEARVAELLEAGASVARRNEAPGAGSYFVVMHDPEGNEFCVA